jgi:peptidoglycan/LPS O-acetylase OafA/YrhL
MDVTAPIKANQTLTGIQFGRAVAAILVVLYHGGRMLQPYLGDILLARFFQYGNAGVDFFFVLSGFIIFFVHAGDIGRPARLGHYLFRRLTRIYPIYWIATAFAIVVFIARGDTASLTLHRVVSSVLLLPESNFPIVGVAWTLCHEMTFYMVFAVLIASRTVGLLTVLAWFALVVAGCFFPHQQTNIQFLESPYHFEFAMGVFTALLARKAPLKIAPLFVFVGVVAFFAVGLLLNDFLESHQVLARLLYGSASALIIYGLAVWEMSGKISFPSWALFLGGASYSIYLFHTFLLGWIGRAITHIVPGNTAPDLFYLAAVTVAVAGSCVIYQTVERRLIKATRAFQRLNFWKIKLS